MKGIKEMVEEANRLADEIYELSWLIAEQGGNLRLTLSGEYGETIAYIILDGAEDKTFRATSLVE